MVYPCNKNKFNESNEYVDKRDVKGSEPYNPKGTPCILTMNGMQPTLSITLLLVIDHFQTDYNVNPASELLGTILNITSSLIDVCIKAIQQNINKY